MLQQKPQELSGKDNRSCLPHNFACPLKRHARFLTFTMPVFVFLPAPSSPVFYRLLSEPPALFAPSFQVIFLQHCSQAMPAFLVRLIISSVEDGICRVGRNLGSGRRSNEEKHKEEMDAECEGQSTCSMLGCKHNSNCFLVPKPPTGTRKTFVFWLLSIFSLNQHTTYTWRPRKRGILYRAPSMFPMPLK